MKKIIQISSERGEANHEWLHAKFSFSFSEYYNPNRMGFGKIVVLNDDIISPGKGFGAHPHENMEIITIPTFGEIAHEDDNGSRGVIKVGQIQVMSAGKGIIHSEYNNSKSEDLKLFQIWIEPNEKNVKPRYETKTLNFEKNKLVKIVSGNKNEDTLFIHQDASIHLGEFENNETVDFKTGKERGTFIMLIEGSAIIEKELLEKRDSIEIIEAQKINMLITKGAKLLIIDTPTD